MKLLDFFNAYWRCRRCNTSPHPPCAVLCAYPQAAQLAVAEDLIQLRQDRHETCNCSLSLSDRGMQLFKQLMGNFT